MKTPKELAQELGFSESIINKYEALKAETNHLRNNEVAELDIIYFLDNILWSANFELVAKVVKNYGSMVSRLDQWKDAIKQL